MSNFDWDENTGPLAYLITFRTYRTWLHGDDRTSIDRHGKNVYGTPKVLPSKNLNQLMQENSASDEFLLDGPCRCIVEQAIRNVCSVRSYVLSAINVRTNHAHTVVSASRKPETLMNAFKANATRELRFAGLVSPTQQVVTWRQYAISVEAVSSRRCRQLRALRPRRRSTRLLDARGRI